MWHEMHRQRLGGRRTQRREGIASSSGSCRIVPKAQSLPDQGQKYTVGFENAFGARGSDFAQLIENKQNTTGYVGQATRPPCQGASAAYIDAPWAAGSYKLFGVPAPRRYTSSG